MDSRNTDPDVKARACKLLRDGASVSEVARETGVSRPTLYKWAKGLEIETAKAELRRPRKFDRAAIREMMQTDTVEDVCAHFGCSKAYAYKCASGELT